MRFREKNAGPHAKIRAEKIMQALFVQKPQEINPAATLRFHQDAPSMPKPKPSTAPNGGAQCRRMRACGAMS